jgi:hypothetical protein
MKSQNISGRGGSDLHLRQRSEAEIKEPRPQRGSLFATIRDHEGAGQLDPRTVTNSIQYVGLPRKGQRGLQPGASA